MEESKDLSPSLRCLSRVKQPRRQRESVKLAGQICSNKKKSISYLSKMYLISDYTSLAKNLALAGSNRIAAARVPNTLFKRFQTFFFSILDHWTALDDVFANLQFKSQIL